MSSFLATNILFAGSSRDSVTMDTAINGTTLNRNTKLLKLSPDLPVGDLGEHGSRKLSQFVIDIVCIATEIISLDAHVQCALLWRYPQLQHICELGPG